MEERSDWKTINARADDLGIDLSKREAWSVGERVAAAWYKQHREEPYKPLVKKRRGAGTHHIAMYPPEFFDIIDDAIRAEHAGNGQMFLFGQPEVNAPVR
jgi:hypothetical protein